MTEKERAVIEAADKYDRAKTAFDEATAGASSITYKSSDAGAVLLLTHSALREAVRAWRESSAFALTAEALRDIMPNLTAAKLSAYRPFLIAAMEKYQINTPLRAAAFLAQLAHESGEFRWMEEIWGPTDAQKKYEGRADLGNTQPGDGKRFKGRGPIQITGRANYKKYGDLLGVDLVGNPDLAAKPEYAFQIASAYWKTNGLNELADLGTDDAFKRITLRINGGYNGLAHREAYYKKAKEALG